MASERIPVREKMTGFKIACKLSFEDDYEWEVDLLLQDAVALCMYTDVNNYIQKHHQPPASGARRIRIVWKEEIEDRLNRLEEHGKNWS